LSTSVLLPYPLAHASKLVSVRSLLASHRRDDPSMTDAMRQATDD
jgi:hypothetical protein